MSRRTEYRPIVIEGWRDIRTSIDNGSGSANISKETGGVNGHIGGGPSGCIDGWRG